MVDVGDEITDDWNGFLWRVSSWVPEFSPRRGNEELCLSTKDI
jgi:hypothetical protein